MFQLAMVQMRVQGGQPEVNIRHAVEMVQQAASQGARVILLPEAMNLGWTDASALDQAEPIPDGPACRRFRDLARQQGLYLCAGLVERAGDGCFNSAILIGPGGDLLLHHRKINELEIAHGCYGLGDRLQVARTPLGTFGLMICADAFVRGQTISRTLGFMGAGMVLSPSSWAVTAEHHNELQPYGQLWLDNYGPVAKDFRLWIAGVSNVGWITHGPWQGRKCIGCSLLIGPHGEPVLQGPYGEAAETILYAEIQIEPRPAQGDAWEKLWASELTGNRGNQG